MPLKRETRPHSLAVFVSLLALSHSLPLEYLSPSVVVEMMARWLVPIYVLLIFLLMVCIVWCYVGGAQRIVTRRDVLFAISRSSGSSTLPIYAVAHPGPNPPHRSPNQDRAIPGRRTFDTFSAHFSSLRLPPLAAGSMDRRHDWVFRMLPSGQSIQWFGTWNMPFLPYRTGLGSHTVPNHTGSRTESP